MYLSPIAAPSARIGLIAAAFVLTTALFAVATWFSIIMARTLILRFATPATTGLSVAVAGLLKARRTRGSSAPPNISLMSTPGYRLDGKPHARPPPDAEL